MKKAGFLILVLLFVYPAPYLFAQGPKNYTKGTSDQAPLSETTDKKTTDKKQIELRPGMELKKIGSINAIVPEGSEIYQRKGLYVLEPPEEYAARRFKEMEGRFTQLEGALGEAKKKLEELAGEVEKLKESAAKEEAKATEGEAPREEATPPEQQKTREYNEPFYKNSGNIGTI